MIETGCRCPLGAMNLPLWRASPRNQWPHGPFLDLPAGRLALEGGHLALEGRWVLACGLSPQHWLVAHRRPGKQPSDAILDQLIGFLIGRDVAVVRLSLRCRRDWFQRGGTTALDSGPCILYWLRAFFWSGPPEGHRMLPLNIWPIGAPGLLRRGGEFWRASLEVLAGAEAHDSDLLYDLGPLVNWRARCWEHYLTQLLRRWHHEFSAAERELLYDVDRHFYHCVTRFLPGYELLPATTARLL